MNESRTITGRLCILIKSSPAEGSAPILFKDADDNSKIHEFGFFGNNLLVFIKSF
jgi:hypothetical protein